MSAAIAAIPRSSTSVTVVIGRLSAVPRHAQQMARLERPVRALFDRGLMQFPPAAIDAEDSFVAVQDRAVPDRRYVAISSSGRSPKFLLQSAAHVWFPAVIPHSGHRPLMLPVRS